MFLSKALILGASLYSCALAQTKIAFTHVPAVVVAGESYNITWGGGDGTSVTITLREGDPNELKTIDTLADSVSDNFFLWTVSKDLKTASDYALQITQGQNDINYSGQFSLTGGTGSSTISASGTTTATASHNSTAGITSTSTTGTASLGTGSAIPRNTTFSSATMSRTTTSLPSTITETSSESATFGDVTSTSAAPTPTAAATTSAPNSNSARVAQLGSSAALVMGIFAAVLCLS
ncbi:hypothetical protein PV05_04824 [Exophiala xenobiotica]|uniref:Yeast cell wall synthesis Kre9/Knh1-like N-terminal domain-containing protein n=1 Tax=Exophiala xenobiotica TaxID=348802 RepID=A0A0D2D157_9EURO|nr:uncharacterized protein PV05_04824 [Exophiala xenobiotica]KIW56142.1 hypothetical protein PV05_04824 [Exophiala xenobiotica]